MRHDQDLKTSLRTDNTKVEDKWKAVVNQEKHYQAHLGIKLQKYREKMRLQNSSLYGAVIGFLEAPPPEYQLNHYKDQINKESDCDSTFQQSVYLKSKATKPKRRKGPRQQGLL